MTADSLCFPMAFFGMTYRVVADDFLTGFAMMTGSFSCFHVLFRMAVVLPVMSVPQMLQMETSTVP